MGDNNEAIVKQSENKAPIAGFNVHPENINRNGRPKKGLTLTDIAKEILEEELPDGKTRKEVLMRKIATLAYEGNETMIKLMWNYVDGMPKQSTEISTPDDKQLIVRIVEDTTLKDANKRPDTHEDKELPSTGGDILEPS